MQPCLMGFHVSLLGLLSHLINYMLVYPTRISKKGERHVEQDHHQAHGPAGKSGSAQPSPAPPPQGQLQLTCTRGSYDN